jgi:hypothetical protein
MQVGLSPVSLTANLRIEIQLFFPFFLFASSIISGPNHGPCVDVKQLASGALLAIALAPWKARFLATVHAPGNGARIPRRDQGQLAEDV